MKKIKSSLINENDRIECVSVPHAHHFFLLEAKSRKRIYLFSKQDFSGSLFTYFRNNGRCLNGNGWSLTIKEIYKDKSCYRNYKVAKLFDRLPGIIDSALSEFDIQQKQTKSIKKSKNKNAFFNEEREIA